MILFFLRRIVVTLLALCACQCDSYAHNFHLQCFQLQGLFLFFKWLKKHPCPLYPSAFSGIKKRPDSMSPLKFIIYPRGRQEKNEQMGTFLFDSFFCTGRYHSRPGRSRPAAGLCGAAAGRDLPGREWQLFFLLSPLRQPAYRFPQPAELLLILGHHISLHQRWVTVQVVGHALRMPPGLSCFFQ